MYKELNTLSKTGMFQHLWLALRSNTYARFELLKRL